MPGRCSTFRAPPAALFNRRLHKNLGAGSVSGVNSVTANSMSAVVPRFDMQQFQPQPNLPPFVPRFNFDLDDTGFSTSSSQGSNASVVCSPICSDSPGTVASEQSTAATSSSAQLTDSNSVSVTFTANNTLPSSNRVTDFSHLNRSNIGELFHHQDLLTHGQRNFLSTIVKKQQLHPQRYRDDYLSHSMLLLLSNGWSSANRYSMCSIPNSTNKSGQCRLHKFCPYCAFLEQRHAMARIVPAFEHGNWFWITGTFIGDLSMTTNSSYYELADHWDAYKKAIQQVTKAGLIRGAFWTEELAVNSLAPVHTLPHIHATIEADEFGEETVEQIKAHVIDHLRSCLGPDHLQPKIHVKSITTQHQLLSHVQYQVKPISIVKSYRKAWNSFASEDRTPATTINSHATDLVLGYSEATKRRSRILYAGNLDSKTKSFIGTKTSALKAAGTIVNEVMKEGVLRVVVDDSDDKTASENLTITQ